MPSPAYLSFTLFSGGNAGAGSFEARQEAQVHNASHVSPAGAAGPAHFPTCSWCAAEIRGHNVVLQKRNQTHSENAAARFDALMFPDVSIYENFALGWRLD